MPVCPIADKRRMMINLMALGTPDVFAIAVFSYLGVLMRILITSNIDLNSSTSAEKELVFCLYTSLFNNTYFVPNILGTFIIGFLSRKKEFFFRTPGPSSYQSFYTGVSTGFCGSLTTFSSWAFSIAENMFEIGTLESIVLAVREIK
jgi:fluoride ion exporter CrcB/FEX